MVKSIKAEISVIARERLHKANSDAVLWAQKMAIRPHRDHEHSKSTFNVTFKDKNGVLCNRLQKGHRPFPEYSHTDAIKPTKTKRLVKRPFHKPIKIRQGKLVMGEDYRYQQVLLHNRED